MQALQLELRLGRPQPGLHGEQRGLPGVVEPASRQGCAHTAELSRAQSCDQHTFQAAQAAPGSSRASWASHWAGLRSPVSMASRGVHTVAARVQVRLLRRWRPVSG